ncbi:hypothetical protein B296_00003990 [Ensete ventricosum]|uniref:DUF7081 domain-containing protein n=1 Tax=Ensete ventricosum TaxID=4639 RepID=A0A427B309_ENSVE|nr:hypothetical protein B296_00003990 [Ensete ventricosum]
MAHGCSSDSGSYCAWPDAMGREERVGRDGLSFDSEFMDDGSNCHPSPVKENRLVAVPVVACSSGLGLPYAPEDWPCPGDRWRWKVGSRKSSSGHWVDRYLYAPPTCPKSAGSRRHGNGFPSRVSVEEYIRKEFPDADVNAFFSSFIWRVPCADFTPQKGPFFGLPSSLCIFCPL